MTVDGLDRWKPRRFGQWAVAGDQRGEGRGLGLDRRELDAPWGGFPATFSPILCAVDQSIRLTIRDYRRRAGAYACPVEARQALEGDRAPLGGLQRAEVRDVLAWLRLLADPQDAAAVVRALTRPPIELRQVDLARVIQLSRRRKLNMIDGLRAAGESPQVPAEGHERIARFLALHAELETRARSSSAAQLLSLIGERLDAARPLAIGDRSADGLDGLRSAVQAYESQRPGATLTELADELGAVPHRPRQPTPSRSTSRSR